MKRSKLIASLHRCGAWFYRVLRNYRARRALVPALYMDERMLRDIGLTRDDIVACLSSPQENVVEFVMLRRKSRAEACHGITRQAA
jgi:uncharacterized protein YjiS (DUF1127 family)